MVGALHAEHSQQAVQVSVVKGPADDVPPVDLVASKVKEGTREAVSSAHYPNKMEAVGCDD